MYKVPERYNVNPATGCWEWTGRLNLNGYGEFTQNGKTHIFAHRAAYIQAHGPVPEGYNVLHRCRVRKCVNPAHLIALPRGSRLVPKEG